MIKLANFLGDIVTIHGGVIALEPAIDTEENRADLALEVRSVLLGSEYDGRYFPFRDIKIETLLLESDYGYKTIERDEYVTKPGPIAERRVY